jgi:hypothetical protein
MAFAVSVINGTKQLRDCPKLAPEIIARYGGSVAIKGSGDREVERVMENMKEEVASIDLAAAAKRIGALYADDRLTVHCLGKQVSVDTRGRIITEIHVNPWLAGPLYNYILSGGNTEPEGRWVHFRDLRGGKDSAPLFGQRCEKPCKKLADSNPDFFDLLIGLFSGKKIESQYESDVSLVLWPLPRVPMLICYWKPEDGLPSELNIFFDSTAEDNLIINAVFTLGVGLVMMFEKIAQKHDY